MSVSSFNFKPQRTQTSPFTSFFWYESALSHTHAHVTFRTLEVWVLTGFNFLNRRPHTQSIAGTHAFSSFNVKPKRTQTSPFSSFFRLEPALPHTHARVTFRTLEVWLLTGFNFFNKRPPTQSIAGTCARIQFQR